MAGKQGEENKLKNLSDVYNSMGWGHNRSIHERENN